MPCKRFKQNSGFVLILTLLTLTSLSFMVLSFTQSLLSTNKILVHQQRMVSVKQRMIQQMIVVERLFVSESFYKQLDELVSSSLYLSDLPSLDFSQITTCAELTQNNNQYWRMFTNSTKHNPDINIHLYFTVLTKPPEDNLSLESNTVYTLLIKQCGRARARANETWQAFIHIYHLATDKKMQLVTRSFAHE
ncbi:MAG: hypothetical protein HWE10_03030 [Gammaproteobacteria bacterium]|nr:hypothetical protein [Gammaproteobacteria bacterium]